MVLNALTENFCNSEIQFMFFLPAGRRDIPEGHPLPEKKHGNHLRKY
jgi:hypothetical protein